MNYLTTREVNASKKNTTTNQVYKTTKQIILSNIFTYFNGMILVLALFVLTTFRFENLLFVLVIVINTVIGIYQEIKAKNALEALSLLESAKYKVNRDNQSIFIDSQAIVCGEYLHLNIGDQVPCDGYIIKGEVEVDESLLTGESDSIYKKEADQLLSGSNIISGACLMKVTAVSDDAYINKLSNDSKTFKKYPSKLRFYLDKILKVISIFLVPIAIMLYVRGSYQSKTYVDIVLSSAGALVGMIPEGLILLVSVALYVSAYKLTKKKVLVKELYCTETLARVDVLCFDKTGTITTGKMKVKAIDNKTKEILSSYFAYFDDENATSKAIKAVLDLKQDFNVIKKGAFSSKHKYSYLQVEGLGTYFFGAYEFLDVVDNLEKIDEENKNNGDRILSLVFTDEYVEVPRQTKLVGHIVLEDEIKENTKKTFDYFISQGVDIKIISGDNHQSVLAVAKAAGFNQNAKAIDMSKVDDKQLEQVLFENDIFGRVSPQQKEQMVALLQKNGKTVAMSGDGINDMLALKKADISFAMTDATSAVKSVANISLLTNDFGVFYDILMEGRRVINNIQRVAALFLTKTFFSISFAILSVLLGINFPFIPIQFTIISALTIGIPAFFLTFEENKQKVKNNFMQEVLSNAGLAGFILVTIILISNFLPFTPATKGLICFVLALVNGLLMVYKLSRPLNQYKIILLSLLIFGAVIGVMVNIFIINQKIIFLTVSEWIYLLLAIVSVILMHLLAMKFSHKIYKNKP